MNTVTAAPVQQVPIVEVKVGVRRRKTLGGLASLQKSIEAHGLIHPILVRNGFELVAGGRRLEACKRLGWTSIPVRRVETMTDEELREIESDENSERLALSTWEAARDMRDEDRRTRADQLAEPKKARADEVSGNALPRNPKGGRPAGREPGSRRAVAEVTGRAPATQRLVEKHADAGEKYPVLRRPEWRQHHAIEATELLERLPEPDRPKAAALIDQDAIPPKTAIQILENVASLPVPERKAIFKLAESGDEHERGVALSRAAAQPDPGDPGLLVMHEVVDVTKRAARACRTAGFKGRIEALAEMAAEILRDFKQHNKEIHAEAWAKGK